MIVEIGCPYIIQYFLAHLARDIDLAVIYRYIVEVLEQQCIADMRKWQNTRVKEPHFLNYSAQIIYGRILKIEIKRDLLDLLIAKGPQNSVYLGHDLFPVFHNFNDSAIIAGNDGDFNIYDLFPGLVFFPGVTEGPVDP